jgi:hypothetical protein
MCERGGAGNARPLMRKTAEDLLAALPQIANENGLWHNGLFEYVEDLQAEYDNLEIGDYRIVKGVGAGAKTQTTITPGPFDVLKQFTHGILNARPKRFPPMSSSRHQMESSWLIYSGSSRRRRSSAAWPATTPTAYCWPRMS